MDVTTLFGRRVMLRPLVARRTSRRGGRCASAAASGSPSGSRSALAGQPDPPSDRDAFAVRCSARQRERQLGTGYGFGIFVDGASAARSTSTRCSGAVPERLRRLLDRREAGRPAATCPRRWSCWSASPSRSCASTASRSSIIPRNRTSRRVVEKLGIRDEGVAVRYLEINGVWEDHVRYAITAEEWDERRDELEPGWLAARADLATSRIGGFEDAGVSSR